MPSNSTTAIMIYEKCVSYRNRMQHCSSSSSNKCTTSLYRRSRWNEILHVIERKENIYYITALAGSGPPDDLKQSVLFFSVCHKLFFLKQKNCKFSTPTKNNNYKKLH